MILFFLQKRLPLTTDNSLDRTFLILLLDKNTDIYIQLQMNRFSYNSKVLERKKNSILMKKKKSGGCSADWMGYLMRSLNLAKSM